MGPCEALAAGVVGATSFPLALGSTPGGSDVCDARVSALAVANVLVALLCLGAEAHAMPHPANTTAFSARMAVPLQSVRRLH